MTLEWKPAQSADRDHPDIEVDLAKIGNPGNAEWASVTEESNPAGFSWAIYARWLWEDIDNDPNNILAEGTAASLEDAKSAIESWVDARTLHDRAQALYDAEDTAGWASFTDAELRALWVRCCDIENMPAYDDEVYDEMAKRGLFDTTNRS